MTPTYTHPLALLFLLTTLSPITLARPQDAITVEPITKTTVVTRTTTNSDTTTTLTSTPSSSSSTLTDPDLFQSSLLNSTNTYRYLHSAPFLAYNSTLATFAQTYASKCIWAHNPLLGQFSYGENLASGYADTGSAVDAWYNEVSMYHFSDSNPTGFSEETGHFTQLVWKGTTSVGCGWRDCAGENGVGGVLLVCDYFPAGNVMMGGVKGAKKKELFVENVLEERKGGLEGFDYQAAIEGRVMPTGTAEVESGGPGRADWGVGRRGWVVVGVVLGAMAFGAGMV